MFKEDYDKCTAKLKAAKQVYGRVRRMKMRAFWKDVERKAERSKNYFEVSMKDAVGALSAAKQEEIKALCDAAQKLAYDAMGYLFDCVNPTFQLSKPMSNGYDMLALIDCEIYLYNSKEYETKFDFGKDKLILVHKEDGKEADFALMILFSLKYTSVEYLLDIWKSIEKTWRKNR